MTDESAGVLRERTEAQPPIVVPGAPIGCAQCDGRGWVDVGSGDEVCGECAGDGFVDPRDDQCDSLAAFLDDYLTHAVFENATSHEIADAILTHLADEQIS